MIIIGLLIGGILKGQELIANAQIAATVAQVKAIDAATTTFHDKYDALPGDMNNVNTRLTNCPAAICPNGDGNGRLATGAVSVDPLAAPAGEGRGVFTELSAADLLGGIKAVNGGTAWGDLYPEAKVAGGFHAGYNNVAAFGANIAAPTGHYLGLVSTANLAGANDALTPNQSQRIDTKLDDGRADTGSVFAGQAGGACIGAAGIYAETNSAKVCDLLIRFQN
jgi:hypothetical protein